MRLQRKKRKELIKKSIKQAAIFGGAFAGLVMGSFVFVSHGTVKSITGVPVLEESTPMPTLTATLTSEPTQEPEPEATPTPKPTKKPAAAKYEIKKAKNGDISVVLIKKGHKKKLKSQFVKLKKATYYVNKKGIALKGWRKIKKQYYYFDRKTAKMHRSKSKVDGITCQKGGAAKQTKYNREKIQVMMSARKVMERITKKTDSKSAKMKKCFRWIMKFPYRRYRIVRKVKNHQGWELDFANDMFVRKQGCCVSNASAYAFLAKECGCKKTYLCDDTGHGWAEVDGRVFDPLFAEAKNFRTNYNARYGVYRLHPIGKKKI